MAKVNIKNIIFIEKIGKNTIFFTLEGDYPCSDTIELLEAKLRSYGFLRTHKSYIVNPCYVQKIERWADRAYIIDFSHCDKVALLSRANVEIFKQRVLNYGR